MKLSFLSLQFKRFPLEYSFQMASKYGFDGVEIWGARPHAYPFDIDSSTAHEIRSLKNTYHVEIPMYTPELLAYPYNLASSSEKERTDTVEYLKVAIDTCNEIECPAMLVSCDHPGYGIDYREAWKNLVSGLKEICSYGIEKNIQIRMESLGPNTSPIVSRTDDLLRLINEVDFRNFNAMMDMAIPPLVAEPISEYFTKIHADYIHLCGCDGVFETHLSPADGNSTVSFEGLFQILKRVGYDGWCSLEILDPYYKDPELYLAESISFLKQFL